MHKCCASRGVCVCARLVRVLLGESSIADRKLDFGASLTVLGIVVEPAVSGIRFLLCAEKARKYRDVIENALWTGYLSSGMSSFLFKVAWYDFEFGPFAGESVKLAGRLMFATQHLFNKVGRALIKPVYAQKLSM